MLNRRAFLYGTIATALASPLAGEAQEAGKVHRIGYLSAGGPGPHSATFIEGLRDLGWTVGRNVSVEWRWVGSNTDRLPELAGELVR